MTKNDRFIIDIGEPQHENAFFEYDEHFDDYDFVCWVDDFDEILKKFNELGNENEQLKQQLQYIQNSISKHIKHQKTELGQKALQKIIEDYNEWLLGHKRDLND